MKGKKVISLIGNGGGGSGTSNYLDLTNKPSINDVTLIGNKTSQQLSLLSNKKQDYTEINAVKEETAGKYIPIISDDSTEYSIISVDNIVSMSKGVGTFITTDDEGEIPSVDSYAFYEL